MIEGQIPKQIYIPKKMMMLSIMRSCIGVNDPKDLWVNNFKYE